MGSQNSSSGSNILMHFLRVLGKPFFLLIMFGLWLVSFVIWAIKLLQFKLAKWPPDEVQLFKQTAARDWQQTRGSFEYLNQWMGKGTGGLFALLTAGVNQILNFANRATGGLKIGGRRTMDGLKRIQIHRWAIGLIGGFLAMLVGLGRGLRQGLQAGYESVRRLFRTNYGKARTIYRSKNTGKSVATEIKKQQIKPSVIHLSARESANQTVLKRTRRAWWWSKLIGGAVAVCLVLVTAIGIWGYFVIWKDLPDAASLQYYQPPLTSKIYDRNGQLLFQVYEDENRFPTQLNRLPDYVKYAHIAIEDKTFYDHLGISLPDIGRAALSNFTKWKCEQSEEECSQTLQGGSTITQQLVKNTLLTPERSFERKIKEAILALQVERLFTKDQILEMYLNQIAYGGTAYGIEAASRQYFSKTAEQLSLGEAALLAGLPAAPSAYSPFGATPEKAIERQHQVLDQMLDAGFITQEDYDAAVAEKLAFNRPEDDLKAPHFVMYLREQLEREIGPEKLYQGGLRIRTSIDLNLQAYAEQVLKDEVDRLRRLNVTNGAVLITKPDTGEILAMVGSTDYFDVENQGNFNATTALRQPGSSIKPLTYATALEMSIPSPMRAGGQLRYTAATVIDDSPITFPNPGSQPYAPQNYDGRFHGKVTVRTALASSYNIPAVKTLNDVGVNELIDMAERLGITTWQDRDRFGLALTLGAGEVRMVDMAVLYGTFANLGVKQPLEPVLRMVDKNDQIMDPNMGVIPSPFDGKQTVLDPRVAFIMNSILSDDDARVPSFGRGSKLTIPNQVVAVKTGTTNSLRDNWTIGYTPDYLVAVWVGNNDNTPMSRVASGITGATPIWHDIMNYLLNEYEYKGIDSDGNELDSPLVESVGFPWRPPEGLVSVQICPHTGTLACAGCLGKTEWFIRGTEPTKQCTSFRPPVTPSPGQSL